MIKKLPTVCPSCDSQLKVKEMQCGQCSTTVSGLYDLPGLSNLTIKDQQFILAFVKASGSLKVMAQNMKFSYPTVRNLLDEIIGKVENLENDGE